MAACRHVRIVNFGLHMRTFRGSEECTAVVIRASRTLTQLYLPLSPSQRQSTLLRLLHEVARPRVRDVLQAWVTHFLTLFM